jgi:hypothetical protein
MQTLDPGSAAHRKSAAQHPGNAFGTENSAATASIAGNIRPLQLQKPLVLLAFCDGTAFADPPAWK